MIKRMGMLAFALALSAFAFAGSTQPAQAICTGPLCFASPGCCYDFQCDKWCGGRGLGLCDGTPENGGGCCYCGG
jgi:hypothetical protein